MLNRAKKGMVMCMTAGIVLTGCGEKQEVHKYQVTLEPYVRVTHESVEVLEGDLCPTVDLHLTAVEQRIVDYHPAKDDMVVKSYNAENGDVVSAGDVLVTFEDDDMDKTIASYETELAEKQLLLSHCQKMIKLGSEQYTDKDLKMISNEISVCSGYLEELRKKKENYSIKAEGHGVISLVSNALSYGHVGTSDTLISITYGEGCYIAETDDPYQFEVDKVYKATYASAQYNMKLVSVEKAEENSEGSKRKLTFEYVPVKNEIPATSNMDMTVEKEVLKNVTYIPETAVFRTEEGDFVSIVGEDGFGYQRSVKVESYVDGYAIVSEGLTKGEKVVLQ